MLLQVSTNDRNSLRFEEMLPRALTRSAANVPTAVVSLHRAVGLKARSIPLNCRITSVKSSRCWAREIRSSALELRPACNFPRKYQRLIVCSGSGVPRPSASLSVPVPFGESKPSQKVASFLPADPAGRHSRYCSGVSTRSSRSNQSEMNPRGSDDLSRAPMLFLPLAFNSLAPHSDRTDHLLSPILETTVPYRAASSSHEPLRP